MDNDGNILVSVIMPSFNAGSFIADAIKSIAAQSYRNIELVIVDDASTDNSIQIIEEITTSDCCKNLQFNLIKHEKNLGSATSRADGIRVAKGDYFCFCDSDDLMEHDMVAALLDAALSTNADIIASPFSILYPNGGKHLVKIADKDDYFNLNNIPIDTAHFSLWNKIFKREVIASFSDFPNANCWDDLAITARAFATAGNKALIEKPTYIYRKAHSSSNLTSQGHKKRLLDQLVCAKFVENWFIKNNLDKQYAPFLKLLKFSAKIKFLRGNERDFSSWKSTFPETNKGILRYKHIPLHYRILFKAAHLLPASLCQMVSDLLIAK